MGQAQAVEQVSREQQLGEVIENIINSVKPQKIILFGSEARGEQQKLSDFDFLVLKRDADVSRVTDKIYRKLYGLKCPPVDVIVITPEQFHKNKDVFGTLAYEAHKEGKIVHEAENE